MKFARFIVIALLLLTATLAAAQDLTETTTIGPITVSHPSNYSPEELMPGGVGMIDETETRFIFVLSTSALSVLSLPEGTVTPAAVMDSIAAMTAEFNGLSPIVLANGEGQVVEALIPALDTPALFYAIETEGGLLVGLAVTESGEIPEDLREIAEAVIGSAVIDPDAVAAAAATEEPAGPETPAGPLLSVTPDPDAEPTELARLETGLDGEECPIPAEALSEGIIVFCAGAAFELPATWEIPEDVEQYDSFGSFNRENYSASLSTSVSEINAYYSPQSYIEDTMPYMADIVNHTDFDAEEDLITAVDEDQRSIVYYDSAQHISVEESSVRHATFIVTLNNDVMVVHTFTWIPEFIEDPASVEADIEQIVMSTTLADFYNGTPAQVEIDGEMILIHDSPVGASTYNFRFDDEESFIVNCPAEIDPDEGTVWGTDIYTHDSSVCIAAAHAGAITLAEGGFIKVTMLPGQESYTGSERNGVTTNRYGEWDQSFSVEPFELP